MEALTPDFATSANRDRYLGPGGGYLAQSDLRELMTAALGLGWSLVAYEADLSPGDSHLPATGNQRQAKQAHNLTTCFARLTVSASLMVWCGWSHHFKRSLRLPDGEVEHLRTLVTNRPYDYAVVLTGRRHARRTTRLLSVKPKPMAAYFPPDELYLVQVSFRGGSTWHCPDRGPCGIYDLPAVNDVGPLNRINQSGSS